MLPLLTFASGLIAGIVGVRLVKSVTAPSGPRAAATARLGTIGDKAQTGLRQATVSGLTVIEKSSANLRAKLTPVPPAPPQAVTPDEPEAQVAEEAEASEETAPPAEAPACPEASRETL
jgi:hypothetical protein